VDNIELYRKEVCSEAVVENLQFVWRSVVGYCFRLSCRKYGVIFVAKRLLEKFSLAFDAALVIPDDELWYFSSLFPCIMIMILFLISRTETFLDLRGAFKF
jgi:hypothetical protein